MRAAPGRDHIAIVGAGIMGCTLALFLARMGHRITLYEATDKVLNGASRWNEGKIHLGFLYGADPSLSTARAVIPGGVTFVPLIEDLLGTAVSDHVTAEDDLYLVHRDSVVKPEGLFAYFHQVADLVLEAAPVGRYLRSLEDARVRILSRSEVDALSATESVVAGATVPERSIDTQWVADCLAEIILTEPRIEVITSTKVKAVENADAARGSWRLAFDHGHDGPFDVVVNASWHGLLALDRTAGLAAEGEWSHRYRVSAFIRTARRLQTPSAVLSVGPFGDVKCYGDHSFYVSWYTAGLLSESHELAPEIQESPKGGDADAIVADIRRSIADCLPWANEIFAEAESVRIEGGFVFARASGKLCEAGATIHRRDRFGVVRHGSYYSVDTGKYSSAPLIARSLANEISGMGKTS
jgi:glycine/D-amino acid oxidase-like deaminating enzyme